MHFKVSEMYVTISSVVILLFLVTVFPYFDGVDLVHLFLQFHVFIFKSVEIPL